MYYTHVNRHVIDRNKKHGTTDPPISVRKGKRGRASYATEVELPPNSRVVYSSVGSILPCGARLVIISKEAPKIVPDTNGEALGS